MHRLAHLDSCRELVEQNATGHLLKGEANFLGDLARLPVHARRELTVERAKALKSLSQGCTLDDECARPKNFILDAWLRTKHHAVCQGKSRGSWVRGGDDGFNTMYRG